MTSLYDGAACARCGSPVEDHPPFLFLVEAEAAGEAEPKTTKTKTTDAWAHHP
jgi:hypothetical protein